MAALNMKLAGVSPDVHSYHYLVEALTKAGEWREAWALIDDAKSFGHVPDVSLYNRLLYVSIANIYHPYLANDIAEGRLT